MEATNQTTGTSDDLFDGQTNKLPGMLNVLTILTFIGCGLAYVLTIYGFFDSANLDKKRAELETMQDTVGDNEMASKMMEGSMDIIQKSHDYRYILLLSGLLFTTLCLVGAMQMRKLKKSGYPLYVIGEIAPVILTAVVMGFSLVGGFTVILGGVIAIIFVILYSTQRKYLKN